MMVDREKVFIHVLIKEEQENVCAKCCKTVRVMERMMETFPEFKENVQIMYQDIESKEVVETRGALEPPAIILNGITYSQGHVPILKKLSRDILFLLK